MTNEARSNWITDVLAYAEKQLAKLPPEVTDAALRSGTRATMGIDKDDPIAHRLGVDVDANRNNTPEEGVRAGTRLNDIKATGNTTQEERNVEEGRHEPLAQYETYDYLHSDDPEVITFMHYLGLNHLATHEAVVTIRQGEPVEVVATSYVRASKSPILGAFIGPEPYIDEE